MDYFIIDNIKRFLFLVIIVQFEYKTQDIKQFDKTERSESVRPP